MQEPAQQSTGIPGLDGKCTEQLNHLLSFIQDQHESRSLLQAILITALVSGLVQVIFFPATAILGASGIVFMMIVLSSLAGAEEGRIPLTLILVVVFYIGGEIINGVFQQDNISQMAHIIGGLCGAVIGFALEKGRTKKRIA